MALTYRGPSTVRPFQERVYIAVILVVYLLLVLSPVMRRFLHIYEFDRFLDGLMIIAIMTRLTDIGRLGLPRRGLALAISLSAYFAVSATWNGFNDPLFQEKLVLLDGKLLLFVWVIYLFQNVILINERDRKNLSLGAIISFFLAFALFVIFPSKERLTLLNESNYMILAMLMSAIVFFKVHGVATMSRLWLVVMFGVIGASVYAQSRTGFSMIFMFLAISVVAKLKFRVIPIVGLLLPAVVVFTNDDILAFLTRNESDLSSIDRFIFVTELVRYWASIDPVAVLFGNSVGTYLNTQPIHMGWWAAKLSADQGIPYGLAAFQFHAAYLRMPALLGVVPAIIVIAALFSLLLRRLPGQVVLAIAIGGVSMSVFNLSSVLPFVLAGFLAFRTQSGYQLAQLGEPPLPNFGGSGREVLGLPSGEK